MADHLKLDAEGRLAADGEEGQKYLASRIGRWRIVPTAPEISLLVREGADGAPGMAPRARCVLSGELGAVPPVDLAAFISQQRSTGILWTSTAGVERSVWFREGRVRWAASSNPSERLGEVTVKLGLITGQQLCDISREQKGVVRRLGQILVERGLINGHDLWKAIQHQITEVFYAFLMCRSGPFAFINDSVDDKFAGHLSLDTQGLLMDGVQRLDEMAHFRKTVPEDAYVRRKRPLAGQVDPLEQRIYALADGERTVQELARQLGLGEFDATKAIFHLVEEKFVECVEGAPAEATAAAGPASGDPAVVVHAFNLLFRTVRQALETAPAGADGFTVAVGAYLASDSPHKALFKGLALDSFGALDEEALLANLSAQAGHPAPARQLAAALDDLVNFMLFEAGECLPPETDEALARKVKAARAAIRI